MALNDLMIELRHLTGGRLNEEELTDLANFVKTQRTEEVEKLLLGDDAPQDVDADSYHAPDNIRVARIINGLNAMWREHIHNKLGGK